MESEWDSHKAVTNFQKHGVEFPAAAGALEDPLAITIEYPDSEGECRFVTLGRDYFSRLLVVAWTPRGEKFRLISARRASKKEIRGYERGI